jgi:hypothetical protein
MSRASVDKARAEFDERKIVDRVMGTYAEVASSRGVYPELVSRWGGEGSVTPG